MKRIGLAMLQGARHEHAEALRGAAKELATEIEIVELRKASHVDSSLDALVLPGGESTTMRIASSSEELLPALFDWISNNPQKPVLGTCAGAILLATPGDAREALVDVGISRNAWGRQRFSFESAVRVELDIPQAQPSQVEAHHRDEFGHKPLDMAHEAAQEMDDAYPGIFIRAPRFDQEQINCQPIAYLNDEVVGVKDGMRLAVTFHPELTLDRRFHRWLLANC